MAEGFPCPGPDAWRVLRVAGVSKSYGPRTVLHDVGFSIRRGETLGLIGPNGAGKTTLFECLGGLLPHEGAGLRLDDRPLDARQRTSLVFYLPDAIAPWPRQTVGWALDFAIGFFGGRPERRGEVVESLSLGTLLGARIGALSKGERKRALLGIGLLVPQPVLLVDEPFDGLDLRQSREIGARLRAEAAGGRTLVLSIHQIADAARVCDRFVLLSGGRVVAEGHAAEVAGRAGADALEEAFLALT
jgi:ABC-2 type transport system ATP-binding protein